MSNFVCYLFFYRILIISVSEVSFSRTSICCFYLAAFYALDISLTELFAEPQPTNSEKDAIIVQICDQIRDLSPDSLERISVIICNILAIEKCRFVRWKMSDWRFLICLSAIHIGRTVKRKDRQIKLPVFWGERRKKNFICRH